MIKNVTLVHEDEQDLEKFEQKPASLSWLIVSTRHYAPAYDWYLDRRHFACYGLSLEESTGNVTGDLSRQYVGINQPPSYYNDCVLMPDLHEYSIEEAADYLRDWCLDNDVAYIEDLDRYQRVERDYWGCDF